LSVRFHVDFNGAAVEQARGVASSLGLDNVEVVEGDVHEVDPAALGGPLTWRMRACS
jgi:hypothetical protein